MTTEDALEPIESTPRVSLAKQIKDEFAPYEAKFDEWKQKSATIKVTSVDDVEAMAMAKTLEKFVGKALSSLERRRKELKAESLEVGKAIDSAAKRFKEVLEPLREELKAKAEFKERYEKERAEAKLLFRRNCLLQYGVMLDSEMIKASDSQFEEIVADVKASYERRIELRRRQEERVGQLMSENLIKFVSAENSKEIGAMSDEEFYRLQEDFKAKLKQEQDEKEKLEKANRLYQDRISIIQAARIADYIGDSMKNVGLMTEEEFHFMVDIAEGKRAAKELNDYRITQLHDLPKPAYLELSELRLYSDEEFSKLVQMLKKEKENADKLAARRQYTQGFSDWIISDEELLSMSDADFQLEANERRRQLKMEIIIDDGITEKDMATHFVEWLQTHPSTPELKSESGLVFVANTKELYNRMANYLKNLASKL